MNRLAFTAAVASIVAVLFLGFMVKLIDEAATRPGFGSSESTPSPKPPAADSLPQSNCQETEDSLRDLIENARTCTRDSDCTLFDYGYPIDCMTSVAKTEITALRLEYRKYQQSCEYRVYYDCPAEPMQRRAICHANRCSVSLEAIDSLEEKTREYLGIRRVR